MTGWTQQTPLRTGIIAPEPIYDFLLRESHETTPIVARLDGRSGKSAEEAGTAIRQTADSPSPGDAGPDNKEAPPTGVDQHKCLGGGVVSENAAAASTPRIILSYVLNRLPRAHVVDGREVIGIQFLAPQPLGAATRLISDGWKPRGNGLWVRPHSPAAIASAREILGRYYGNPLEERNE